ncbi:MAG: hypothetical protein AAF636_27180 [Pseudomonadota bacterium]
MKFEPTFLADQSLRFQQRGALFAIDQMTEKFLFVSENAHRFAGARNVEALINSQMDGWLGRPATHALRNAEAHPSLETRRQQIGRFHLAAGLCEVTAFSSEGRLIVEVVQVSGEHEPTAQEVLKDFEVLSDALCENESRQRRLARLVTLLRTMSGYHCVALTKMCNNSVHRVAQSGRSHLTNASCEMSTQLNVVADVTAPKLELSVPTEVKVPDMTLSLLRLPGKEHRQSIEDVGAMAQASIGLCDDNGYWWTLSFAHERPKVPNRRTEFAVAHIGSLLAKTL